MITNIQNKHNLVKIDGMEYYTIDGMDMIHKEMLRLLKIIDKIAIDNKISYWIASGNMIGVVRHHGFIPWDDDLDIELLKVDYIKLIKCLTEYSDTHNDAFIFYPSPQKCHCCNYFASTKFFLRSQGSPSVYPVKVDIRPYNCIQNTKANIAENKRIKDIANWLVFGKSHGVLSEEELNKINPESFFDKYNTEYGLYDATKEDAILLSPYYEYSIDFEFRYKHLFPLIRKRFEDTMINMPIEYDYILTSIYGDYLKLPQLKHRVPAACELYVKETSVTKLKKHFGKLGKRRIENILFLVNFLGPFKFCKYFLGEKGVETDSNYEDAEW